MKAKLAKKLVSSLAASAVLVSVFAACDLGLTPYVAPVDGGGLFDAGNTTVDSGAVDSGSDASTDAGDGGAGPKRVFVTSGKFFGDFSQGGGPAQPGQAGADNVCQAAASKAGLGARFVAWVSETGKDAIDHVNDVGPWYLVDRKTLVFANKAAIKTFPLVNIDRDENGAKIVNIPVVDNAKVWTGTTSLGVVDTSAPIAQATCVNWTVGSVGQNVFGLAGEDDQKDDKWTSSTRVSCASSGRLYCFEQ